jgi:excisionase family DNA binding protein
MSLRSSTRAEQHAAAVDLEGVVGVRYRLRVVRTQTAERVVNAASEEAAIDKVRAELDRPYGLIGPWEVVAIDIDLLATESTVDTAAGSMDGGPLLLSIKEAAAHLGISRTILYDLLNRGEVEFVRIGSRRLVSREALNRFIEANTSTGR